MRLKIISEKRQTPKIQIPNKLPFLGFGPLGLAFGPLAFEIS
jgi:hypothetical protein